MLFIIVFELLKLILLKISHILLIITLKRILLNTQISRKSNKINDGILWLC